MVLPPVSFSGTEGLMIGGRGVVKGWAAGGGTGSGFATEAGEVAIGLRCCGRAVVFDNDKVDGRGRKPVIRRYRTPLRTGAGDAGMAGLVERHRTGASLLSISHG
jgi:hypothetical protein